MTKVKEKVPSLGCRGAGLTGGGFGILRKLGQGYI